MSRKATNVVAYLTLIGLIIALLLGDRAACRFHLNQALTLCVCSLVLSVVSQILEVIPVLGWLLLFVVQILYLVLLVLTIVGIINAAQDVEKPLPIVGGIQLLR